MLTTLVSFVSCATCIGQEGEVTTLAANGAVYVMLGLLAMVFTCVFAVVLSFVRRARRAAALAPGSSDSVS